MSTHATRTAPARTTRRGRTTRTVLRVTTLAACVPYLTLKIAWIAGSRIGIPEGSALRRDGNSLMALNALTVLMDAAVIALAFLLTRPWGGGTSHALKTSFLMVLVVVEQCMADLVERLVPDELWVL
ncbi:hypothetical protein AB0O10_32615, partial [Streptomyces lydicus]